MYLPLLFKSLYHERLKCSGSESILELKALNKILTVVKKCYARNLHSTVYAKDVASTTEKILNIPHFVICTLILTLLGIILYQLSECLNKVYEFKGNTENLHP